MHGADDIEISLPVWRDLELDLALADSPWERQSYCNTGVPHLVVPVADVDAIDVAHWGPRLRHHAHFAPAGVNVNWVSPDGSGGAHRIRTYERGV